MSGVFPLVLDDAFRAEVMRVVEYASRPEHYYVPAKSPFPPGDMPEYTMRAGDYRIVYSVTVAKEGGTYRHMTVSLQREGAEYPAPISLFTIAHMFGFTGADVKNGFVTEPGKWMLHINKEDRCIVVAEPIGETGRKLPI